MGKPTKILQRNSKKGNQQPASARICLNRERSCSRIFYWEPAHTPPMKNIVDFRHAAKYDKCVEKYFGNIADLSAAVLSKSAAGGAGNLMKIIVTAKETDTEWLKELYI